jgi:hypothetical protein
MEIVFAPLFEVSIHNAYYQNGISKDFKIIPTPACQFTMAQYGLLFRQINRGMVVMHEVSAGEPVKPINEKTTFSFMLIAKNPYLENYSKVTAQNKTRRLYYFSNMANNKVGNDLMLNADSQSMVVNNQDICSLTPLGFTYGFSTTNGIKDLIVQNAFADTVIQKSVHVTETQFESSINLSDIGPGCYHLKVDGVDKKIFYASADLAPAKAFGVIDIHHDTSVPGDYALLDGDGISNQRQYQIRLDNRDVIWKYQFVVQNIFKGKQPVHWDADWPGDWKVVYPPDTNIKILPQMADIWKIKEGVFAVPFVSDSSIPLTEIPVEGIRLEKQTAGNSNVKNIGNLPNPRVDTLSTNTIQTEYYSEMFIYI